MHFKNQRALIVRGKAMSSKSRRLPSVEGLTHRAERRKSHRPDTDSRLLTEMEQQPNVLAVVLSTLRATGAVTGTAVYHFVQGGNCSPHFEMKACRSTADEKPGRRFVSRHFARCS